MKAFYDNFSHGEHYNVVFRQSKVPIFQNKIYLNLEDAINAPYGSVELVQSEISGFIYNRNFDPTLMNYDVNYQNEQGTSKVFQNHLQSVFELLKSFEVSDKKIIEIGCGKGVFFEKMLKEGFNCIGFDPTYEGDNPNIIKEYFSEKYNNINADVIIMRHTLEHIPDPFTFIHTIATANNYSGRLFIEVPTFDWIAEKKAFWDIFFEHCNYFTEKSLSAMFDDAQTGRLFGGQYIYLWADLSKLRKTIPQQNFTSYKNLVFDESLEQYKCVLSSTDSIAIWGAGAKGSTFLNLLDPEASIVKYVIDINPVKQHKHIACTGHKIHPPSILQENPVENVIIMNNNYFDEIKQITDYYKINTFVL
jgi:hypothetical protein